MNIKLNKKLQDCDTEVRGRRGKTEKRAEVDCSKFRKLETKSGNDSYYMIAFSKYLKPTRSMLHPTHQPI